MHLLFSAATLCSSLLGLSTAAALGSSEDYASGSVHAHIMGIKMVCNLARPYFNRTSLT